MIITYRDIPHGIQGDQGTEAHSEPTIENDNDDNAISPIKRENERWIDHWQIAEGSKLRTLIASTKMHLSIVEPKRERRRSKREASHDRAIEGVVTNLAYLVIRPTESGRLVVPMDTGNKRTRYQHP